MSVLAEYRDQRRQDKATDAAIRRDDAAAAAARRRADRAAAVERATARRQERRAVWAARRAALPDLGMSALWATMIVLPIMLAWAAQAAFAEHTLQISTPWNHAFPAAIEVGAWLCAFEAHRRIRNGESAGSLPRWMWVLASVAATINAAHGIEDAGLAAGLALGALSLLGVLLHSIRQSLDATKTAGGTGTRALRTLRYPRLSFAAASIRAARELDDATAWRLAWEDRYGVGPDSPRRERRLARAVVRRETREDRKAAKKGELIILGGRVRRTVAWEVRDFIGAPDRVARERTTVTADVDAPAIPSARNSETPVVTNLQTPVVREFETADEQGELSPRAKELLVPLKAAIAAGRVPSNPSVKRIRTWATQDRGERLGVPAAQELRTAVSERRVIELHNREVV